METASPVVAPEPHLRVGGRNTLRAIAVIIAMVVGLVPAAAQYGDDGPPPVPQPGVWRVQLETPGGVLPFSIKLREVEGAWTAAVRNGSGRSRVATVELDGSEMTLGFGAYDSVLELSLRPGGTIADGVFAYTRSGNWHRLPARAEAGDPQRFRGYEPPSGTAAAFATGALPMRWEIKFDDDETPAVGVFELGEDRRTVTGTILTATGDYGHLAGRYEHGRLRLSTFDGGHAFLFDASLRPNGTLVGTFWSGAHYQVDWIARPNANASLPDAWAQTRWTDAGDLSAYSFATLDGNAMSLGDERFEGTVRIVELFGSWCPNCHDAAALMGELHDRYAGEGLSVVGLAFERDAPIETQRDLVRQYVDRHGVRYPVLIAGLSDKARASEAFPLLDRVRAYPTTIFIDRSGTVRRVHTGYTGPATGEPYQRLRREFVELVEQLLAEE